jgi:hypothetical protein
MSGLYSGPRRRGRPRAYTRPMHTTTVRVEVDKWEWFEKMAAKDPRTYNLTRVVNVAIRQLMKAVIEEEDISPEETAAILEKLKREAEAKKEVERIAALARGTVPEPNPP